MLFPCFFHPFCRSHTSTACSFLHCKGQLSKPWLDILLYQDKRKFNKQMNNGGRKKIPKEIIKTLLKKEWKCRDLLEESMLPEERKWCAFSTYIPYFFQLMTKCIHGEDLRQCEESWYFHVFSVLLNGRNKLMRSEYRKPAFHSFSTLFQSFLN